MPKKHKVKDDPMLEAVQRGLKRLSGRSLEMVAEHAGVSRATVYQLRQAKPGRSVRYHTVTALDRVLRENSYR